MKVLSVILAPVLAIAISVNALAVSPISNDTLLKYFSDPPNSANDNIVIEEVSDPTIEHGFNLTVKTTLESTWDNPQDCYYCIWIVSGDARITGKNGDPCGIDLSLGGSIDEMLGNRKRCAIIQPSYTGPTVTYSTVFTDSSAAYSEALFMGLNGIAPPAGIVFSLDFDLKDWPTAEYNDDNRYYTIVVTVNDVDRTPLGRSDFYTFKIDPATTGESDTIAEVHVIGLTDEADTPKTATVIWISIAGACLFVLIGAGVFIALKRKKKQEIS